MRTGRSLGHRAHPAWSISSPYHRVSIETLPPLPATTDLGDHFPHRLRAALRLQQRVAGHREHDSRVARTSLAAPSHLRSENSHGARRNGRLLPRTTRVR